MSEYHVITFEDEAVLLGFWRGVMGDDGAECSHCGMAIGPNGWKPVVGMTGRGFIVALLCGDCVDADLDFNEVVREYLAKVVVP